MVTKIKLFQCGAGEENIIELKVNKFIESKDVLGTSTARNSSGHMDLVITYKE
jgi:hypothetical protein